MIIQWWVPLLLSLTILGWLSNWIMYVYVVKPSGEHWRAGFIAALIPGLLYAITMAFTIVEVHQEVWKAFKQEIKDVFINKRRNR